MTERDLILTWMQHRPDYVVDVLTNTTAHKHLVQAKARGLSPYLEWSAEAGGLSLRGIAPATQPCTVAWKQVRATVHELPADTRAALVDLKVRLAGLGPVPEYDGDPDDLEAERDFTRFAVRPWHSHRRRLNQQMYDLIGQAVQQMRSVEQLELGA